MKVRVFERMGKKGSSWCIDYTHKGRRFVKVVARDRRLAEMVAKKVELELYNDMFFPEKAKSRVRFKDFVDEYIEKHSKRNKRSWPRDVKSLKRLLPVFGDMYLADITPRMIEDYRLQREKSGVSPTSVNREHALLKHMFTKAMDWGLVRENPAKRVKMAREKPRSRFLTVKEMNHLLEAATRSKALYLKPMLVLALNTAMRKGEILNLRWEDVDFERSVIKVIKTKNAQPREVPMTDSLFNTLLDWRQSNPSSDYVFVKRNGQPLKFIEGSFVAALKRAGIRDFRFHDLRHTAASYMHMAGLDILDIKEIGGWKSMKMVARYSHISDEHKRARMVIFESYIQPRIETKLQQMDSSPL